MFPAITLADLKKIYIVCQNTVEAQQCIDTIRANGFAYDYDAQDHPHKLIFAINNRNVVYSIPIDEEAYYLDNHLKGKRRFAFKDFFKPKEPISEAVVQSLVNKFKELCATDEDRALSFKDLEKEKIDIGHCYDLEILGVLANYRGKFFLKNYNPLVEKPIEFAKDDIAPTDLICPKNSKSFKRFSRNSKAPGTPIQTNRFNLS